MRYIKKDQGDGIHVHLAANTVSYRDGRKRREDKARTERRQKEYQRIVQEAIRERHAVGG